MKSKLIIICGLPGSGKTTLARKLENTFLAIRFCPDEWMQKLSFDLYDEVQRGKIENLQWELAQSILKAGGVAIIEWGTWGQSERDALRLKAREIGASVDLYYLHASADELYDRITVRGMENPPIKRETVLGWFKVFQAPDRDEIISYDNFYQTSNLKSLDFSSPKPS